MAYRHPTHGRLMSVEETFSVFVDRDCGCYGIEALERKVERLQALVCGLAQVLDREGLLRSEEVQRLTEYQFDEV